MFRPRSFLRLSPFLVVVFFCLSASRAVSQTNVPVTSGFASEFKIWTSGGTTFVNVRLTFSDTGWSVKDWGTVTKVGNEFIADAKVYRWTGPAGQAITYKENTYTLGTLPSGFYSFTFKSHGTTVRTQQFDTHLIVEQWEPATLPDERIGAGAWTYQGITTARVEFHFPDMNYVVVNWGQMNRAGNGFTLDARIERRLGPPEGWSRIVDRDFELGPLPGGDYTITVKINGAVAKTRSFTVPPNPALPPRVLTESGTQRAIAIDSVSWLRLSGLGSEHNFSPDRRVRILLLATDIQLNDGDSLADVTATAEDATGRTYPMTVEYVGKVPNFDWLTQITLRPPDELIGMSEIGVSLNVRGLTTNKVQIGLRQ